MKLLLTAMLTITAFTANANCIGSGNYKSCTDQYGNSYSVAKFGNTTNVTGYNPRTGSTWNSQSRTIGNTTYQTGNTNGKTWNQTIRSNSYGTHYQGMDSNGKYFNTYCTRFGCN